MLPPPPSPSHKTPFLAAPQDRTEGADDFDLYVKYDTGFPN